MLEDITNNPNLEDPGLVIGRLLASAVLLGGLVSRSSLEAFYDLLPRWTHHAEKMDDRLAITWTDKGTNYRRWIPDAMTALLLLRLPQQQPLVTNPAETEKQRKQKTRSAMDRVLRHYLRKVTETREQCPETLHEFLDAALLDLEVRLPRALTQYAAGRQTSHSLRPRVWWRLMGKPPVVDTSAATDRPHKVGSH